MANSKLRKKAPVQAVQPVHPVKAPYDPMTPPIKKQSKSGQARGQAEAYNTIARANG